MAYQRTSEDYRILYDKVWMNVKKHGKTFLGQVTSIESTLDGIRFDFLYYKPNKDGGFSKASFSSYIDEGEIDVTPIRRGVYNMQKSCIVIYGRSIVGSPSKYRKGLHKGNTSIFDPFRNERELLNSPPVSDLEDPYIIDGIRRDKIFSPEEALDSVSSYTRLAAGFSKEYYLGIHYKANAIALYKYKYPIARINSRKEVMLKPAVWHLAEDISEYGFQIKKINR